MTEPKWILEQTIIAVHTELLAEHGGPAGVIDPGLLASALNRPKDKYAYEQNYSLFEIAAAYAFGIVKNHPFVDGNKRTAFIGSTLFLELNSYQFNASETDAAMTFENLAAGKIEEIELATWLKHNSTKVE